MMIVDRKEAGRDASQDGDFFLFCRLITERISPVQHLQRLGRSAFRWRKHRFRIGNPPTADDFHRVTRRVFGPEGCVGRNRSRLISDRNRELNQRERSMFISGNTCTHHRFKMHPFLAQKTVMINGGNVGDLHSKRQR